MNIIIVAVFYLIMVGVIGYASYLMLVRACKESDHDICIHEPSATFCGIFWPIVIPIILGVGIVIYIANQGSRRTRREQRKKVEHERTMAEIEARRVATMEAVKFLAENNVKADVPGLYEIGTEHL